MHEISKRMKKFPVFMFQRAKEMALRCECYFLLLVEMT